MNKINDFCISNIFEQRTQSNAGRNLQHDFARNLAASRDDEDKNEELKSRPVNEPQTSQTIMFVNSAGERILAISGPFGTMYLKIGYATDHHPVFGDIVPDTDMSDIIEAAADI